MKRPDISLRAEEPLRAGLLRIVDTLVQYAVGRIERPTDDRAKDVHLVRTSIKQLRAILRLVRPAIGCAFFERENAHLRKAAQRLAFARDTDVARQTLAELSDEVGRDTLTTMARGFEKQATTPADLDITMSDVARDLEQVRRCIARLRVPGDDWQTIEPGLVAVYRRGRKRMNSAFAAGDDEAFHKWRIFVKHLYYELQFLESVSPKRLGKMIARLKKLQDLIGANHDVAMLKSLLQKTPDRFGGAETVARVVDCLATKSRRLRCASEPLGTTIFCKKPRRFTRKLSRRWNDWRKPARDRFAQKITNRPAICRST
jgi:CHAD domain-containing protein